MKLLLIAALAMSCVTGITQQVSAGSMKGTYVAATPANTTPSGAYSTTNGDYDNLWWYTPNEGGLNYFFSNSIEENSPVLTTTVSGLPRGDYKVYGIFYHYPNTGGANVIFNARVNGGEWLGYRDASTGTSTGNSNYWLAEYQHELGNVYDATGFTVDVDDWPSNATFCVYGGVCYGPIGSYIATPQFAPEGGIYGQPQSVAITSATPGVTIRYTTDGVDPTETTGTAIASGSSVLVDRAMVLKAKAWAPGWLPSDVKTAEYTIYTPPWVPKPAAIQTIYRNGVPHTDNNGVFRLTYDPNQSFFPIGNYYGWFFTWYNQTWTYQDIVSTGYNCSMIGQVPSLAEADEASAAGIKLIFTDPNDTQVNYLKNHPSTLAYRMYDEPTGLFWSDDMAGHYQTFMNRKAQVKAMDPVHPFFTLDVPWFIEPATTWWTTWNTSGDVSSHDNYPLKETTNTISNSMGIPESVSFAVQVNNQNKPLWFCAQAFGTDGNLKIPTPAQERCMVYTSIIHGATGIIYFIFDSYVSRESGCIGMAPNPLPDYGHPGGLVADNAQLRASRTLWFGVAELNAQLNALKPAILSPTSTTPYEVYVSDSYPSVTANPIRTLLKNDPAGGLTLLLTNVDGVPQKARIRFPNKNFAVQELYGTLGFTRVGDFIEIDATAWDNRIFRIFDVGTIGEAKAKGNGEQAVCSGIVSAVFPDCFYIESIDRTWGVRVEKANSGVNVGQVVNVIGSMQLLPSGERALSVTQGNVEKTDATGEIAPLGMSNKSLGGGKLGLQSGVAGASGLGNIGLLVRVTGKVGEKDTSANPAWFKISDGSDVDITIYGAVPAGNPYVTVTGISSCRKEASSNIQRVILATDIAE